MAFSYSYDIKVMAVMCCASVLAVLQIAVEPHRESKDGYKLTFRFVGNAWFENEALIKQVDFVAEGDTGSQICSTTGTKPRWKNQVSHCH